MHLRKLPLALAVGAAVAAPLAHGQDAQRVEIYGKLYPYLEQESGSGQSAVGTPAATLAPAATGVKGVPTIKGMSTGNSYLGIRGKEDMGGGLKAEYQIEGVVALDNPGAAAFSWNRNNFVGLVGRFGEVRLGFMDTVFKEYGDTLGILGISSGTPVSSSNILRKISFGTNNAARFHERRANSVRYDSPEVGGVQAAVQVATQENGTATLKTATTQSFGLKYDDGPIYASLAYEIHSNFFGGSINSLAAQRNNAVAGATSKDQALQAAVEWRINKSHTLEFDVINKQYAEDATANGRFEKYKNTAYMLAYDGRWGQWRTMAHIVKSGAGSCTLRNAACSTTGLEGSQVTAGAGYYLSRRTFIYGVFSQITNGTSARFSAADFGAPSPGEDVRHILAGISHSF
ncbi:MAG: porin [Burkholderiaceae bacterium]